MKYLKTMAVVGGVAFAALSSRADIELDYNGVTGSSITFLNNGTFSFVTGVGGNNFFINNDPGGDGSALNDLGTITGTYTIGSEIGSSGVYNVSGSGLVTIKSPGANLTGDVTFSTISAGGTAGNINVTGSINLTSIFYASPPGTQADLEALALTGNGIDTVSFTIKSPITDVADLKSKGFKANSWGGSMYSAVPEPTTIVAGALLLLPFGLSAVRALRKDKATIA